MGKPVEAGHRPNCPETLVETPDFGQVGVHSLNQGLPALREVSHSHLHCQPFCFSSGRIRLEKKRHFILNIRTVRKIQNLIRVGKLLITNR